MLRGHGTKPLQVRMDLVNLSGSRGGGDVWRCAILAPIFIKHTPCTLGMVKRKTIFNTSHDDDETKHKDKRRRGLDQVSKNAISANLSSKEHDQNHSSLSELSSFIDPLAEGDDYPQLRAWARKPKAEAIEEGDIGRLLFCLGSMHQEVRSQALIGLRQFSSALEVGLTPT